MQKIVMINRPIHPVPPRDAQAIATALEVLSKNSELAHSMGENGRTRAAEQFDLSRTVDDLLRMIDVLK